MRHKRRFSRMLPLVAVIAVLAMLAAACGGGGGSQQGGVGSDGDGGGGGDGGRSQRPSRIVVAQLGDAESFDTPVGWNTEAEWIEINAYDCLMFASADESTTEPMLAERWEWVEPTVFRVYLREGIKFVDGTELTAADVKFHYERVRDGSREQYIVRDQYQFFTDIVIHDDYTLDFITPAPDAELESKLSQTGCGIPSKAFVEANGPEALYDNPVGTGPYILEEWEKDERVVYRANPDYWRGEPRVKEFIFRNIPEASTRLAELLTGGVDVTFGLNPQDEQRIRDAGLKAVWAPSDRGYFLFPRLKANEAYLDDPELNRTFATEDPAVREAIELAIDKYALRDLDNPVGEAVRSRAFGLIPEAAPGLWGPAANLYDPDRARQILADAGYAPGEPTLVFHAADVAPQNDIARAIKQMLETVGFTVDLRLLDLNTFRTEIYFPRRTQELILLDLGGNTDPVFTTLSFHTDQGMGPSGYGVGNPELDELLECAWTETQDPEQRLACYHEANRQIAEHRYVIGLFQMAKLWGMQPWVEYTPRVDNYILGFDFDIKE